MAQTRKPQLTITTKTVKTNPSISVVIPLLNEDESLGELYGQIITALTPLGKLFELIFVDDGSTDQSFSVLQELHKKDRRVKVIRFRRNFGKSAALSVGFHEAQGDTIITMDADLQDDPAEIPGLIDVLNEGYDLVSGWKKKRHDPLSKTIPSRLANSVTAMMTGIPIHDMNCGLKAYRKEVVKGVSVYGELHRYIPALAHWAGYRVGEKIVNHRPRQVRAHEIWHRQILPRLPRPSDGPLHHTLHPTAAAPLWRLGNHLVPHRRCHRRVSLR